MVRNAQEVLRLRLQSDREPQRTMRQAHGEQRTSESLRMMHAVLFSLKRSGVQMYLSVPSAYPLPNSSRERRSEVPFRGAPSPSGLSTSLLLQFRYGGSGKGIIQKEPCRQEKKARIRYSCNLRGAAGVHCRMKAGTLFCFHFLYDCAIMKSGLFPVSSFTLLTPSCQPAVRFRDLSGNQKGLSESVSEWGAACPVYF